jgi:PKD domain
VAAHLSHGVGRFRASARTLLLGSLGGAACALVLSMALAAPPSGAVVSGTFGVQQRRPVARAVAPLRYHGGPILTSSNTYAIYWDPAGSYRPAWLRLIDGYLENVNADSGKLSNVFAVDTQYTGTGGTRVKYESTFRGAYTDTDKYPTSGNCSETLGGAICLTDTQIRSELKAFIEANHLPTGQNVIYFVLTPPNINVCTDAGGAGNCSNSTASGAEKPNGFCGYHSAIEPSSPSPVVYAVQPWVAGSAGKIAKQIPLEGESASADVLACQNSQFLVEPNQNTSPNEYADYETGLADVIINDLSIEQQNIVVDPLLSGWYQEGTKAEQGDVCQYAFAPLPEEAPKFPKGSQALPFSDEVINGHPYYLQWAFSSVDVLSGKGITCWEGVVIAPHITAPSPVNPGDIVGFDANESNFTLDANLAERKFPLEEPFTAPLYTWSFGDGVVNTTENPSVFHSYAAAGKYTVVLSITDSGENTRTFSLPVTVLGPVQEKSASPPGAGGGAGSSAPGAGAGPLATPKPAATALPASHSWRKALKTGFVVDYTVNERVTGHFEVLLASAIARRIHLRGAGAVGLPAGTPAQTVIGKAFLVTTGAGHSKLRIRFSPSVVSHLRKLRGATVLLRLVVRNASAQSSTVLMAITLSR